MRNYVKMATEAYREANKIPLLSSARIEASSDESNLVHITSVWNQINLASYKKSEFSKTCLVDKTTLGGKYSSFACPIESVNLSTYKDGVRAVVKSGKEESEQFIEIWEQNCLKTSYNLKDIDAHGKVYADAEFGGLVLSEDLSKLVYIAEKKQPKKLPFLHQGDVPVSAEIGTQYDYRQDWGEQLVDKVNPVIAVLDLNTVQPATVKVFDQVPADLCPGKLKFWQTGIVGLAYRNQPRKLGKVYCSNRDTVLFYIDIDGNYRELRSGQLSGGDEIGITKFTVHSQTGKLCWFERKLNKNVKDELYPGPHEGDVYPVVLDNLDSEPYLIDSSCSNNEAWGAIFIPSICDRSWLDENSFLISCPMQQTPVPVLVNCKERKIDVLSGGNEGVVVLDVHDGIVIASKSDPITPPHLVIARYEASQPLRFQPIFAQSSLENLEWSPLTITPDTGAEDGVNFPYKSFLVGNKTQDSPLIVWPHGGPHSVMTEQYFRTSTYFCNLGFNILFVNYRGSLGWSHKFTTSLMGRVGDMDVKDCVQATEQCLEMYPHISKDKVFLMGGSHGGFLVTHLAGQYPKMFKGVVARNPVTNIAAMCEVTDIPDWTFNEAGGNYTWSNPDPAMYQQMWARSPISHAKNIEAPIFLMIGKNDLRVPPSQGYQFYFTLKNLKKTVYMHEYADNHPLGVPDHDANVMITAANFYLNIIHPQS